MVNELKAVLGLYSRVFLARFDLHLPEFTSVEAGNKYIRQLFKRLRDVWSLGTTAFRKK
jgi:hypothetical protein